MAILFTDSFDHYATANITTKWTSTTGTVSIGAFGRRSSNGARTANGSFSKTLAPANTTCVIGAALTVVTVSAGSCGFDVVHTSGTQMRYTVLSNGTVQALRGGSGGTSLGVSTVALSVGVTYYLEVKTVVSNTGSFEVRLNGVNILSGSGVDTQAQATEAWTSFNIFSSNNANFDDLYVLDGAASADATYPDNNFLGDVSLYYLTGTAEGNTIEWTPSTGTDNAAMIDEATPDTADYNSATATEKDTFVVTDSPVAGALIYGYQTVLYAQKTDNGACTIAPVIRSNAADYVGTSVSPSNGSWAYFLQPYSVDPATNLVPTETDWNAGQFGYKRVT